MNNSKDFPINLQAQFIATQYKGKPAIYDKQARVFYFGFKTIGDAAIRARQLNDGKEGTK